jgi:hypothetical protein
VNLVHAGALWRRFQCVCRSERDIDSLVLAGARQTPLGC